MFREGRDRVLCTTDVAASAPRSNPGKKPSKGGVVVINFVKITPGTETLGSAIRITERISLIC